MSSTLAWINYILLNHTQQVVLEGVASGTMNVTSGVPHGSVLWPILFLLYINYLLSPLRLDFLQMMHFFNIVIHSADDCKILHNDLTELTSWEDLWLMNFNPSKCEVLTVTH